MTGKRRYSRLTRYAPLGATLTRWQAGSCAVVGLGGLGGGLALQLARFGVGRIVLIDRDIVTVENLGHQSLFTTEHARQGLPKAAAAAEVLAGVNPYVEPLPVVEDLTRHTIGDLLDGVTLIFDGLDNYYTRLLLNDYSRQGDVPYFYAGVVRGELSARAVIPHVTGCLRCLIARPPAPGEVPTCAAEGVFPPLLGVANALQLEAANRYLAGEFTAGDDILYSLSLPGWELRQLRLNGPRADCPACGGRYEYMDGTLDTLAAGACAPDRAEAQLAAVDLQDVQSSLSNLHGWDIALNAFCIVIDNGKLRYTVFPSGKVVQEGSASAAMLRAFISEYIGA